MKVIKLFSLLFTFTLLLGSCNQKAKEQKQKYQGPFANYAQTLTKADTVNVTNIVTKFMDYAQQRSYKEAAALLYKPDADDVWNEPILLDNDELCKVAEFLGQIPFDSYSIDNIRLTSPVDTHVKCSISYKGEKGQTTRKLHFKPINYLGGWRLCLMN